MDNIKALHLFNNYLPDTEHWAYRLIKSLPDCEIHIGANQYLQNAFYDPAFRFIDNDKNTSGVYKWLKERFSFFEKSEQQSFLKRITTYVKRNDIEIIHTHFAHIGWSYLALRKRMEVPFIVSFYGWDYEKLPFTQPIYKERYQSLFKIADGFVCEGEHGASILLKQGCPAEKIHVVSLGIEPKTIPFIKREKKPNKLRLVQIASFTSKKGHRYVIEALALATKTCPNIELTFVGSEREQGKLQALKERISKLGLEDKIRFQEQIDYKKIHTFLGAYDVFIHPSCYTDLKDCEGGAPVVLLDAQATGMPVISTTHCDIPKEVIHEKTGLLSPEKEVKSLAENIIQFYKMDDQTYQGFAKNARAHIEKSYDINENAKELSRIYRKIYKAAK